MNSPHYATLTSPPTIIGQLCNHCGREFFPVNPFGCEACGADISQLVVKEFPGRGLVHSCTTTFVKGPEDAGFTVGVVNLEQGFSVRAMLDHSQRHRIKPGVRVHAVAQIGENNEALGLYFTPDEMTQ